ncbi:RpiB/LacA/LacB family sugar-phosphate isomerase [Candidatus Woesearchaeota archaeon]|nr:RpiB/LacA/LacB family sugar-phosphate isomerase [Candidatus Woesearchaeota archaeon]
MKQKIFLGSDHAGFELKEEIKKYLKSLNFEVEDEGPHKLDHEDDYPDFIVPVAKKVAQDPKNHRGIIFGASGQGEAIAANKIKGVRAALYYGGNIDIVRLSRTHNNANILSIGARFLKKDEAIEAIKIWLNTDFSNEAKHIRRINKIDGI